MLVLSRKNRESVVIGGSDGIHRLLKVTVLEIRGVERETGLRGRSRRSRPSLGGVGENRQPVPACSLEGMSAIFRS